MVVCSLACKYTYLLSHRVVKIPQNVVEAKGAPYLRTLALEARQALQHLFKDPELHVPCKLAASKLVQSVPQAVGAPAVPQPQGEKDNY